jgi:hypothetical protein
MRSLYQPDQISNSVETPSATPSMTPRAKAGAPSTVERNTGRMAVAISWFQSLNRLASPMPRMLRFNQPLGAVLPVDSEANSDAMPGSPLNRT